jgi:hypothetical protein
MSIPETFKDLVLECIPKSRPVDETELWDRIVRRCQKHGFIPIFGQAKSSITNLYKAGSIRKKDGGVYRVV